MCITSFILDGIMKHKVLVEPIGVFDAVYVKDSNKGAEKKTNQKGRVQLDHFLAMES